MFLKFSSSLTLVETLCARKEKQSNICIILNLKNKIKKGTAIKKTFKQLLGRENLEIQLN